MAIALVVLTAGCGSSAPKLSTPPSTIPPPPATSATNLVITGPARMAPGQSAQFTVNAPASATVRWISSPPTFLQISSSGLATAGPLSGGAAVAAEVTITGPGGGVTEVRQGVLVMPDGTYILSGTVYDAEFPSTPVLDARVEVSPGALVTETSGGYYRLYGVPPNAELRVTASGYQPSVQTLTLSGNATQNVELTPSGPRLNLTGAYTLSIDVTDGCRNAFPAALSVDLQHRQYAAVVTQNGLTLDVSLTEPRFKLDSAGRGRRFSGRVTSTGATFALDGFDSDWGIYPSVAERLSDETFLVVDGSAATTGSSAGLSGAINGQAQNWDSSFPATVSRLLGSCAGSLRFALTPR